MPPANLNDTSLLSEMQHVVMENVRHVLRIREDIERTEQAEREYSVNALSRFVQNNS